jgi:curved DNA-binding protein
MPSTDTEDFYAVLGVDRDATVQDLQRAYRTLARRYHPDVNKEPGAEDRFKQVGEAYEVLSDPESRARYDQFGRAWRQVPPGTDYRHAGPFSGAGPWRQAEGPFSGSGRAGDGRRQVYVNGQPVDLDPDDLGFESGGVDIEDLLGGIFSGRAGTSRGARRGPAPGGDVQAEIQLSVEDAYAGGARSVTLTGPQGPHTYEVTLPAGVVDGQRIRLGGQGQPGSGGAHPGDLYLIVRLLPHPRFRVAGRDVTVDLALTPWEAALGATVPIPTPGGGAKVTVPPGTSTGRRLRLRERGFPHARGAAGDLYAEVRVIVPTVLSAEERQLFEQLRDVSSFDPRSEEGVRSP